MLTLTVAIEQDGLQRKCRALILASKDLTPILRRMGALVRQDSADRFAAEGPGWEPRKGETEEQGWGRLRMQVEQAQGRAERKVLVKLRRDFRRAKKKFSPEAAQRRYEIIKEFEGFLAAGRRDLGLVEKFSASKTLERTKQRLGRQAAKEAGRLLGRMAGANRMKTEGKTVVIRNIVKNRRGVPFSKIHNEGGTAGNGAVIKAREFLGLTPEVAEQVPAIARNYYYEKWEEA